MDYNELALEVPIKLRAANSTLTMPERFVHIVDEAVDQILNRIDHDAFKTTLSDRAIGTDGVLDLRAVTPLIMEVRSVELRVDAAQAYPTRPLTPRAIEALAALYPAGASGDPVHYAQPELLLLHVYPRPAAEVRAEVRVNQKPPQLTASTPTNVLTEKYPRALTSAVLMRAALFMKDYEAYQAYQADMAEALTEVTGDVGRKRRDETDVRPRRTENVTGQ